MSLSTKSLELVCEGYEPNIIGNAQIPTNLPFPLAQIYPYFIDEDEEFLVLPNYVAGAVGSNNNVSVKAYTDSVQPDGLNRLSEYIQKTVLANTNLPFSGKITLLSLKQRLEGQYSLSKLNKQRESKPPQSTSETILMVPEDSVVLVKNIVSQFNAYRASNPLISTEPNREDIEHWHKVNKLDLNEYELVNYVHGWSFIKDKAIIEFMEQNPFHTGVYSEMVRFVKILSKLIADGCPTALLVSPDNNWSNSICGASESYVVNEDLLISGFICKQLKLNVKGYLSYENESLANLFSDWNIGQKIDKLRLASFPKTYGITSSTSVRTHRLWTEYIETVPFFNWLNRNDCSKQQLANMFILLIDDFYQAQSEGINLYLDASSLSVQTFTHPLKFLLKTGGFVILQSILKVHKFSLRKETPLVVNLFEAFALFHLQAVNWTKKQFVDLNSICFNVLVHLSEKVKGGKLKDFYADISSMKTLTERDIIDLDTHNFIKFMNDLANENIVEQPATQNVKVYDVNYESFKIESFYNATHRFPTTNNTLGDYTAARVMLSLKDKLKLTTQEVFEQLNRTSYHICVFINHEVEVYNTLCRYVDLPLDPSKLRPNRILTMLIHKLFNACIWLYEVRRLQILSEDYCSQKVKELTEKPLFTELIHFSQTNSSKSYHLKELFNYVSFVKNKFNVKN